MKWWDQHRQVIELKMSLLSSLENSRTMEKIECPIHRPRIACSRAIGSEKGRFLRLRIESLLYLAFLMLPYEAVGVFD